MEEEKITLEAYRHNAMQRNLCKEFVELWGQCTTSQEMIDLCLSAKGIDYTCNAISQGWGISNDEIYRKFRNYINGNYISNNYKAYTSEMYCNYVGKFIARTTAIVLIDSSVIIQIPEFIGILKIYCVGKCNIKLDGKASCIIVTYGNTENININEGECGVKYINKINDEQL